MPIRSEELEGNKQLLTIEGEKANSFGADTLQQLSDQLDTIRTDENIVGVILTGAGNVFSVGGNVFAMADALEQGDASQYLDAVVPLIEKVVVSLLEFPKPVIAAVNGAAAGGGLSMALACDEIISVDHAKFGMAFGGLALSPDSGSSILFAQHFGRQEAIHGIATARVYTASEVEDRGIITIVTSDNLLSTAASRIDEKVSLSPYSYAKTKLLVNQPIIRQLEHNLPLEYETIVEASTRDEFAIKVQQTIDKLTN